MTKKRARANNPGLSARKALSDCQHDAVVLAEMLDAIDLMGNEGKMFDSGRIAVTIAALERAQKLATDLDDIDLLEVSS